MYQLIGIALFVAALLLFLNGSTGTGAALVAVGVVFSVMDGEKKARSAPEPRRDR